MFEQPIVNAPLAWKTLEHIETHPEELSQELWRCGTGMCFGGHAATFAGGTWLSDPTDRTSVGAGYACEYLLAEPGDDEDDLDVHEGQRVILAQYRAKRVCGLTTRQADHLFHATNRPPKLRQLVEEYTGETR